MYLLRRLLLSVLTLWLLSMLVYGLSTLVPGDPVLRFLPDNPTQGGLQQLARAEQQYRRVAATLGLDKPPFYFSIRPAAWPDTLYRIMPLTRRQALDHLTGRYGNWPLVQEWHWALQRLERALASSSAAAERKLLLDEAQRLVASLGIADNPLIIRTTLRQLGEVTASDTSLAASLLPLIEEAGLTFARLEDNATPERCYVPDFKWYGLDNRYHWWLGQLLRRDMGISLLDSRPVRDKLADALVWTLMLNGLSLALVWLLGIPMGLWMGKHAAHPVARALAAALDLLYSMPSMWVAMLLLVFFTTPMFGMDWFEGIWLSDVPVRASAGERLRAMGHHMVLPVVCLTYPVLAFFVRQLKGGMVHALQQEYVWAARARGLAEWTIAWRHAFRNALFPLITLAGQMVPRLFAGSVIIETIFNIPGMGRLIYEAILRQDWPVAFAGVMIAAVLTIAGYLLADMWYHRADPRVRFGPATA